MYQKILFAVLLLLVGAMIYLIWRPESLLIFNWIEIIGQDKLIYRLRYYITQDLSTPPEWVIYSLPNCLWLISGFFLFEVLWQGHFATNGLNWLIVFCLIAVGSEFAQLFHIIPGTYDNYDLLMMLLCIIVLFITRTKKHLRVND